MKPTLRPTLLSVLALAAFPFAASAEPNPCCGARNPDVVKADFSVWNAQAVEGQINNGGPMDMGLRVAAEHWEASASLRPLEDAEGVSSLRTAAKLIASQDGAKAVDLLLDAANWSTQIGDPVTAAHSYLDAATVLLQRKWLTVSDVKRMDEWVASAERLARSATVTPAQKQAILARTASW